MALGDASLTERAIAFAVEAHRGQVDRSGRPVLLHLLRVMLAVTEEGELVMASAVLHHVLTGTKVRPEALLQAGMPQVVVMTVRALTRSTAMKHPEYLDRVAKSSAATQIKIASLQDDLSVETDTGIRTRARRALSRLEDGRANGNVHGLSVVK